MKQKRHTPEEIIKKRREAEALIVAGKGIDGAVRGIGVSAATCQRWKSRYGDKKQDAFRLLRELERDLPIWRVRIMDNSIIFIEKSI